MNALDRFGRVWAKVSNSFDYIPRLEFTACDLDGHTWGAGAIGHRICTGPGCGEFEDEIQPFEETS